MLLPFILLIFKQTYYNVNHIAVHIAVFIHVAVNEQKWRKGERKKIKFFIYIFVRIKTDVNFRPRRRHSRK